MQYYPIRIVTTAVSTIEISAGSLDQAINRAKQHAQENAPFIIDSLAYECSFSSITVDEEATRIINE